MPSTLTTRVRARPDRGSRRTPRSAAVERRRRPDDRRERIDAREQVQQRARRQRRVRASCTISERCDLAAERRLARAEERGRAGTQTIAEPVAAPKKTPPAESRRRSGVSLRPPRRNEPRDDASDWRAPRRQRADEAETASTASSTRRSADAARGATHVGAGHEPAERERADDEPAPPAAERREGDDRERDPVDGRHAGQCRSTVGASARLQWRVHGGVVQLVRTPACHAGGRGFESRRSRSPAVPTRRPCQTLRLR